MINWKQTFKQHSVVEVYCDNESKILKELTAVATEQQLKFDTWSCFSGLLKDPTVLDVSSAIKYGLHTQAALLVIRSSEQEWITSPSLLRAIKDWQLLAKPSQKLVLLTSHGPNSFIALPYLDLRTINTNLLRQQGFCLQPEHTVLFRLTLEQNLGLKPFIISCFKQTKQETLISNHWLYKGFLEPPYPQELHASQLTRSMLIRPHWPQSLQQAWQEELVRDYHFESDNLKVFLELLLKDSSIDPQTINLQSLLVWANQLTEIQLEKSLALALQTAQQAKRPFSGAEWHHQLRELDLVKGNI
jgi:hypothetical protein